MRVRRTTGWVVATALLSVACGPSGGDRAPGPVVSDPKLDVASALDGPDHPSFPDPLIELDDLVSGGPPPDGIPPIDRPRFAPANRVDRLVGDEPVLSLTVGEETGQVPVGRSPASPPGAGWHGADSPSMTWTLGGALTDVHRERLLAAGTDPEVLAGLDLRAVAGPLPDWWHVRGNVLYLHGGPTVPEELIAAMALIPFDDALLVIASTVENMAKLHLGGSGATVFLGPDSSYTATDVFCGGGSSIVLNADTTATRCAILDARNGGSIVTAPDQLWAADVYLATDDMHRLEDAATGVRLNPYGAHIRLGRHVWLGRDAIVTGNVEIGDGAVVGMRSLVRGQDVPPRTAVAGCPARVIRKDVVWTEDDSL